MAEDPREHTTRNTHATVERLLRARPGGRRVLDVPCGDGAFTRRLLEAGYEVTSADVRDGLKVQGSTFAQADMNAPLPWGEGAFDAVACIDGIEHLERPFDFVSELHRVLAPGGLLLLSTPNISALRSRWRYLLTGFHNKGKTPLDETNPSPWHHINLLAFPALRYMLHRTGFELLEVATNRVKPVSWLYAPLVPLTYLVTRLAFQREEDAPDQRRRNKDILAQLFTRPVLFGETIILVAHRGEGR
jgi:2-polyprenyl-3-methyl-5-hydroxy-6-metoxy-1,4-benzoquinol methylase